MLFIQKDSGFMKDVLEREDPSQYSSVLLLGLLSVLVHNYLWLFSTPVMEFCPKSILHIEGPIGSQHVWKPVFEMGESVWSFALLAHHHSSSLHFFGADARWSPRSYSMLHILVCAAWSKTPTVQVFCLLSPRSHVCCWLKHYASIARSRFWKSKQVFSNVQENSEVLERLVCGECCYWDQQADIAAAQKSTSKSYKYHDTKNITIAKEW